MGGNRGGHGLNVIFQVIEARIDDGFAKGFKTRHVERYVVIDEKDSPRAMLTGVANVCDHAFDRKGMKIPAAHFDDRTKAAIKGASARGLHDIDLATYHGITAENPCLAIRQPETFAFQPLHRWQ